MGYRGEQYDLHESLPHSGVEVIVDDDPSTNFDAPTDNEGEIEPIVTTQSYSKGPDGSYYLYNSQTGELDLNQPLPLMSEQEVAFETASAMGAAEVAVLAPGGTETQEIWSIQSLELSITAEGREVIILRATTEIREIVKEPEEEPEDSGDAPAVEEGETPVTAAYDAGPDDDYDPTPSPQPLAVAEVVETASAFAAIAESSLKAVENNPVAEAITTMPASIEQDTANYDGDTGPIEAELEPTTIAAAELPPALEAQESSGGFESTEPAAPVEAAPIISKGEVAPQPYETPAAQEKTPAQKVVEQDSMSETGAANVELEQSHQPSQEEPLTEVLATAAVDEDSHFEHQPKETLPEPPRPAVVAAPVALPPEKVVYLRKAPATTTKPTAVPKVVKAPTAIQTTQQRQAAPPLQHEHRTEQHHTPPVIAMTERLTTQQEVVVRAAEQTADEEEKTGSIAKAPTEVAKQTTEHIPHTTIVPTAELEETPAIVVAPGSFSSANLAPSERREQQGEVKGTAVKEQGIMPPRWERERNSQTLMPWLGVATTNTHSYDTEDDVVITFNPGIRAHNRRPNRLTRTGSIAA